MSIPGYADYQRREYCQAINCPVQMELDDAPEGSQEYESIRAVCQTECRRTAYEFHHWLIQHGFLVVKPIENR